MRSVLTLFLVIFFNVQPNFANICHYKTFQDGLVCVCNRTFCDTLEFNLPAEGKLLLVSTNQNGLRFSKSEGDLRRAPFENVPLSIDVASTYQSILGFGGALTGSSAHLFEQVDGALKKQIIDAYFSPKIGLGYTFIRTSIGGCDFDLVPWAYNEEPEGDHLLSNFTELDQRDLLKLSILKEIETQTGVKIKLLGTAWSPPRWMKTNGKWTGLSALKSEYYETWADYHVRFLTLMKKQNVNFWGITTGNEPMNGTLWWMFVRFMSMGWIPKEQGKWLAEYLGPKMRNLFKDVKILAGDDQRYTFTWWFEEMQKGNPKAVDYIDGFAVHWYWDGFIPPKTTLDKAALTYPDKFILNTESCAGDKPLEHHGPIMGSWVRATLYIEAILQDLAHSVNGWIDWNLILDSIGGPNYARNFVDAPVILSEDGSEIYKQPIFYVLGHFSRFILPGSAFFALMATRH